MVLLAVDIGNAHTHLGLIVDGQVSDQWRLGTDLRRTADEWAVAVRGVVGNRLSDVDGLALCSAVPAVQREWREMIARIFPGLPLVVVGPGVRTGVPLQVENPREVGADRICRAVGAVAQFGGPCVVVDCGSTVTTFDVVNAAGAFVGGAIAPGMETVRAGLTQHNAQLRDVEVVAPRAAIAKNTVEALQAGIVFGMAAQVEGMLARIISELDADPADVTVVTTGYLADLAVGAMVKERFAPVYAPALTLQGLELIYHRNS